VGLQLKICFGPDLGSFGPDDVVIEAFPADKQPMAQTLVADWLPNQAQFKPRAWSMAKGGFGRTKQIELERLGRLQRLKSPGGEVGIWSDSWYRMALIDLAAEEPPPKIPPKRKRPPRPRTQAELDALARGRATMRARREAETAS
jgi:hypothetical protein